MFTFDVYFVTNSYAGSSDSCFLIDMVDVG
jgi:hypothetical protein